jgi:hypothetical protein
MADGIDRTAHPNKLVAENPSYISDTQTKVGSGVDRILRY